MRSDVVQRRKETRPEEEDEEEEGGGEEDPGLKPLSHHFQEDQRGQLLQLHGVSSGPDATSAISPHTSARTVAEGMATRWC